MAVNVKSVKI